MQVDKIFEKNTKELDLTEFFRDIVKEDEKVYITIKKLSLITIRKIQIISIRKLSDKNNSKILQEISKYGKDITDEQMIQILTESNPDTQSDMMKLEEELEKIVIDDGVDEKNHNFTDTNDKQIKLNYKVLCSFNDPKLLSFIVKEIRTFSNGISIKK
jgi:hypothetical protein